MSLSRRSHLILAALCAVLLPPALMSAPAAAEPAALTSEELDKGVSAAQEPLRRGAHVIRQAVEDTHPSGYMSIAFGKGEVELYWKGALPAPIQAAVARARRTIPVRVIPAKYSFEELDAASEQVRRAAKADSSAGVRSVRIPYDGSGLRVGATESRSTFVGPASVTPKLPVAYRLEQADRITRTGRLDDHEQWNGGGRIRRRLRPDADRLERPGLHLGRPRRQLLQEAGRGVGLGDGVRCGLRRGRQGHHQRPRHEPEHHVLPGLRHGPQRLPHPLRPALSLIPHRSGGVCGPRRPHRTRQCPLRTPVS